MLAISSLHHLPIKKLLLVCLQHGGKRLCWIFWQSKKMVLLLQQIKPPGALSSLQPWKKQSETINSARKYHVQGISGILRQLSSFEIISLFIIAGVRLRLFKIKLLRTSKKTLFLQWAATSLHPSGTRLSETIYLWPSLMSMEWGKAPLLTG